MAGVDSSTAQPEDICLVPIVEPSDDDKSTSENPTGLLKTTSPYEDQPERDAEKTESDRGSNSAGETAGMSTTEATGIENPSYSKGGEMDTDSWPEEDRAVSKNPDPDLEKGEGVPMQEKPDPLALKKFTDEEEKILEVLREVVRKCTNPDPMKRPTAAEVLEMLNKCPVD